MKASKSQRKNKSQEGRWARSRGVDKPRRVSEPIRGERGVQNSQGRAALYSRTFCFLMLSLHYRGSVLAWPFYSQCIFSLGKRSPSKSLSCYPPKNSSHTHSSCPYCCPSCPPALCRAISTQRSCFHLKPQYIYSGPNPLPSPQ